VEESSISSLIFRPSIIYTPGDPWLTLLDRLSRLPAMPISGSGKARFQPVWAEDAAEAVMNSLSGTDSTYELAGPEVLSYDDIVRTVLRAAGRRRRLLHVPLPVVRASLKLLRFATWEEAELMEEPMVTERGTADIETLGVSPRPMSAVLP
jgi:uncharacterized protein YbjT (DUF2867 family)